MKLTMETSSKSNGSGLFIVLLGTTPMLLGLDLWVPEGVAVPLLFSTIVLLAGWWLSFRQMLAISGASSAFVGIGFAYWMLHGSHPVSATNHGLGFLNIWITTALVWLHKQQEARVQRLTGLLPMCSLCRKVRNDRGLWSQVEQYFEEHHADLQFTHGLCPACSKQLYPELFPRLSEKHPEIYR